MSTIYGTTEPGPAATERQVYYSPLEKYWDGFREWRQRERLRSQLCCLTDNELADIGITRGEVDYVASMTQLRHPQPDLLGQDSRSHPTASRTTVCAGIPK